MALIGIEGFDHWRNGDQSPFDNGATISSVGTGAATRFNYGQSAILNISGEWNLANQAIVIQGAAARATVATVFDFFSLADGGTIQVQLQTDYTNRRILIWRGPSTTGVLLGQTPNAILPNLNEWCYIEWKVTIDNAIGSVVVRVDDIEVLNLSGIDTQATANARATVARLNSGQTQDDYYCCDGSGAAPFNDFLGNSRIYTEYPTANDTVQWTPTAGSNFQNVDDPGDIDGDTTTNTSATTGQKDLFSVTGDIPAGATVKAVEMRTTMRKDDATARQCRARIKSGATEAPLATRTLTTGYLHYRDTMPVDPTDAGAWTSAKVNALKIGYEVVS